MLTGVFTHEVVRIAFPFFALRSRINIRSLSIVYKFNLVLTFVMTSHFLFSFTSLDQLFLFSGTLPSGKYEQFSSLSHNEQV